MAPMSTMSCLVVCAIICSLSSCCTHSDIYVSILSLNMGNTAKKPRTKKYVIHSSFIRKFTSSPLVDVNNSLEVPDKYQLLFVKLGDKEEDKAIMKVIFMSDDTEIYAQEKTQIDLEWEQILKLNEHQNIVHYWGREFCLGDNGARRCEILRQHCPTAIEKVKCTTKLQMLLWITQVGEALAHAHVNGLSHGNVCPELIAVSGELAILKGFSLCKFTGVDGLSESKSVQVAFVPPELVNPTYKSKIVAECKLYWEKKQDIYMWASTALQLLGFRPLLARLNAAKADAASYEKALAEVYPRLLAQLTATHADGLNPGNVSALISACLRMDPVTRPSIEFVLKQFEVVDRDIADTLKSLCQVCGKYKKRLHQLECNHMVCSKCITRGGDEENEGQGPDEDRKELLLQAKPEKRCEICNSLIEIGFVALKCGCKCFKKALEQSIVESTKEKILTYNRMSRSTVST